MSSFTDNELALLVAVFKRSNLSSDEINEVANKLEITKKLLSLRMFRLRAKIGNPKSGRTAGTQKALVPKPNPKIKNAKVQSGKKGGSKNEGAMRGAEVEGGGSALEGRYNFEGEVGEYVGEGYEEDDGMTLGGQDRFSRKHSMEFEDEQDEDPGSAYGNKRRSAT